MFEGAGCAWARSPESSAAMNHPPAMGGRTAWGVSELLTSKANDDPAEMLKIKAAAADFQAREEARLQRLKSMQHMAGDIMQERQARRQGFDMKADTNDGDYKKTLDENFRKMQEAKEEKRLHRKEERARLGLTKKAKGKKKKKEESSGSSDESSSDESSSSSSDSKQKGKKSKKSKEWKVIMFDKFAEPELVQEAAPMDPEQAKREMEARAREREVKKRAKEQAALWAEEVKRKEAEVEAKRQQEAKRKVLEAEAKRKADAEAKKAAEEEEAKKKSAEDEANKAEGGDEKRKLFATDGTGRNVKAKTSAGEKSKPVIGGYFEGQTVYAAKNITVKGQIVVKKHAVGTVVGPSETNPSQRIAVQFAKREDRMIGNMNVVPAEIKKRR